MRKWLRVAIAAAGLALMVAVSSAPPAGATFPGRNGPIAYRPVDPETGFGTPLLRARADGTRVTQLTDLPGFFSDWSANGKRIAFDFFEPDGNQQIATMAADGRDLRVITSGPGIHEVPSWSPSGRRIVFGFSPELFDPDNPEGFETRLWTMRANGGEARPLPMNLPGFDVEARYAPNGRWIAFARLRITASGDEAAIIPRPRARWPRPPAHPVGSVHRAPHLVAGQPLDHVQLTRGHDRGHPPGRQWTPHDPAGDRRVRRP